MAERRATRRQLRHELRGRLRTLGAGWRRPHRRGTHRSAWHGPDHLGPRSRRRRPVRIWQPRRLLAPDAPLPGTRAADDRLRLRAGVRAQSRGLGRDRQIRLRHLLAWLALDQALRTERSRGTRPYPQGDRLDREDDRRAAARLVLPLWSRRQYAPADRRRRRLPLRFGLLRRRASILGHGGGQGPACGAYSLT